MCKTIIGAGIRMFIIISISIIMNQQLSVVLGEIRIRHCIRHSSEVLQLSSLFASLLALGLAAQSQLSCSGVFEVRNDATRIHPHVS
jgi:hypothetical protein